MNNPLVSTLTECFSLIFQKQKLNVIILILVMCIIGIIPSIDSILLQNITDRIELYSDQNVREVNLIYAISKWIIIYGLWWEGTNITWRIYDYVYLKAMPEIKSQVITHFYNYTQYHDHIFFQKELVGSITKRITESARSIEMIFAYINEKLFRKLSMLIFAILTLYIVHINIALIFTIWAFVFIGMSFLFAKKINNYSTTYAKDNATIAGKIVDSISNISIVRLFNLYKSERRYLSKYLRNAVNSDQKMQWFMFKLRYALGLSCTLMICPIVYYIVYLRSNLEISIGQCVLVLTLCVAVIDDMWDLSQEIGDAFEQIGIFHQSMSLFEKYKITDHKDLNHLVVKQPSIDFKNVTFTYHDNENEFKNQSISFKPFERIGLIGFSGSGKTTFTNLISRLYEIDKGQILIDNQDIKNVSLQSLRDNISIIPQEPILFHRSIKENIRCGNLHASDEDIENAARSAHIHDFILTLPRGYNSICGEKGNNLSGGQRQRITIARAFLKKSPILILDEITSALDNHTDYLIQKSIEDLMKNKTIFVIAHRISTIKKMDRILIFERGHIIADGDNENLAKNEVYKRLCRDIFS